AASEPFVGQQTYGIGTFHHGYALPLCGDWRGLRPVNCPGHVPFATRVRRTAAKGLQGPQPGGVGGQIGGAEERPQDRFRGGGPECDVAYQEPRGNQRYYYC